MCDHSNVGPLVVLALAVIFGGADQYLGSLSGHPWAAQVSLLSAPWLVLPFLAGASRRDPRHAAVLGLGATLIALGGYCAMTLSPLENARFTVAGVADFVRSDPAVVLGGLVTGPLFGWLGYRWRTRSAWGAGLLTALTLSLEPVARHVTHRGAGSRPVWLGEVITGVVLAVVLSAAAARRVSH